MVIDKCCLQCGEALPDYTPSNKQYCSDACKQSAYRDRLVGQDEEEEKEVLEEAGELHPLTWLGMIGLGVWLLKSGDQTRNIPVTTPKLPFSLTRP